MSWFPLPQCARALHRGRLTVVPVARGISFQPNHFSKVGGHFCPTRSLCISRCSRQARDASQVRLSPDGSRLFVQADGRLRALETTTGSQQWSSHQDGILVPSQDGRCIFVGGRELCALAAHSGEPLWTSCVKGFIQSLVSTADGATLFCGTGNGELHAVVASSGDSQWYFAAGSSLPDGWAPAVRPDGGGVVFWCGDGCIRSMSCGVQQWLLGPLEAPATFQLVIAADGTQVFSATSSGIRALGAGEERWTYDLEGEAPNCFMVSSDGQVLYVGTSGGKLHSVRVVSAERLWVRDLKSEVRSLLSSPDGRTVFAATKDGKLHAVGISTWVRENVGVPVIDPHGLYLLVQDRDRLSAIATGSGELLWTLESVADVVPTVSFDGARIFVVGIDGLVQAVSASGEKAWHESGGAQRSAEPALSASALLEKKRLAVIFVFVAMVGAKHSGVLTKRKTEKIVLEGQSLDLIEEILGPQTTSEVLKLTN